ncbi:S41 family peptidase [Holdemania massiliensis]|uniref:S41 family peptidase n=1 Tax=Holdemania massiliensis TaxID=1468449 RepID=UPI001F06E830|nr:S41 family peptidase [Holdemania massiliensis]MCH1939732.1 S41 family peptidase [Holdemania massiliensis]
MEIRKGQTMKKKILYLACVLVLMLTGCSAKETPNTENPKNPCSRTVEERVAVLSEIWSTAQYYYGNWIVMPDDFDWDAKYHEFLPRIIQAENDTDYVNCLREFVALLQDGHTDFVPASDLQLDSAFLPFSLVDLDGQLILDGSSRNYDVPLGSELMEVEGQPAWDYIEEQFAKYVPVLTEPARQSEMIKQFLKGEKGTGITLKWLTPQAETLEVQSTYEASGMQYFNQLSPTLSDKKLLLSASPYMVYEISEELVYVEISTFLGQSFQLYENQVIPILENYQGVILDVRNNHGGNFTNALTILQSFSDQPVPNGYYFDSEFHSSLVPYGSESDPVFYSGSELNRKAARMMKHQYYGADADIETLLEQQEPEPYPILTTAFMDKPVVVLTSQFTASSAESFAATAKLMDNFTLIGLRTYGISGNNNRVNLSDGSFYSLTVDLCFTPDKQLFWNQGVQPDIEVKMTLEDLLEEKDTVLIAAMETLQRQIQERTAR